MEYINKPLAPFGELLIALQKRHVKLGYAPWVFCGRFAAKEAYAFNAAGQVGLYVPYGADISQFTWPVNGVSLILFHTGGLAALGLKKTAFHLLKAGADKVILHCQETNRIEVYLLNNIKG